MHVPRGSRNYEQIQAKYGLGNNNFNNSYHLHPLNNGGGAGVGNSPLPPMSPPISSATTGHANHAQLGSQSVAGTI